MHGLHKDYPLVPDKIEIKKEILSNYQLNIADFYNIPIGIVKNLLRNFFDRVNDMKSKCKLIWKLATLLKVRIEAKKDIVY